MLLLHLSDIHFRTPSCLTPRNDPETLYRSMIVRDVRKQCEQLGPVGAILITGDIAFQAHPDEYAAALKWIAELASAGSCSMSRIYVVPGNHDVDLKTTARTNVRNAQRALHAAHSIEREFADQLKDPDACKALFEPLTAYNEFARQFKCGLYGPHDFYWTQDIALDHGVYLRLNGLTSTFLSGLNGQPDTSRDQLFLGPQQLVLLPEDGVVHLVMSHHPPDWFRDHATVESAICNRAQIQLFGHRHIHRVTPTDAYIRFSAGATNPERHLQNWDPGYNLIDLQISENEGKRTLNVEAHCLHWQADPDGYVPKKYGGKDSTTWSIGVSGTYVPGKPTIPEAIVTTATSGPAPHIDAVEVAMSTEDTRELIYRFWQLTMSQRREIATALELLSKEEFKLEETERYSIALIRAGERNLIKEVGRMIAEREQLNGNS